jgi:c-di-GMP-related signal transduction protein
MLTKEERETHVVVSEDQPKMTVTTSIRKDISMLQKRGYTLVSVDHEVHTFEAPKQYLSFRSVQQGKKRKISEEQLKKMQEARRKTDG